MIRFHNIKQWLIPILVIAVNSVSVSSQTSTKAEEANSPRSKSAAITLSIAVSKDHIPVGQTPWVTLTVKNLTDEEIAFPPDRVHVESENGEPPTTMRQRQLTNRRQPGEPSILSGGFEPSIPPEASFTRKYDLSRLYDLSKPGKYTVYIEVFDAFHSNKWKGGWVRSPVVHFEITGPTH
jgi:hypothetical protein